MSNMTHSDNQNHQNHQNSQIHQKHQIPAKMGSRVLGKLVQLFFLWANLGIWTNRLFKKKYYLKG